MVGRNGRFIRMLLHLAESMVRSVFWVEISYEFVVYVYIFYSYGVYPSIVYISMCIGSTCHVAIAHVSVHWTRLWTHTGFPLCETSVAVANRASCYSKIHTKAA